MKMMAGMYKKFLNQSNLAGEDWACKVVDSVVKVQAVVAGIHSLVDDVKRRGEEESDQVARMLARACSEVSAHVLLLPCFANQALH